MSSFLSFDIGACELKIAKWDGSRVTRLVSAETPDNLVKDGVIVSYEAMADIIRETVKANRLGSGNAAVVLPSRHAFLRRVTLPYMTPEQLDINLPYEFRDYLTTEKDKYYYAYTVNETVNDEEGKPVAYDLTAAAVLKDVVNDYRTMFRRAGLRLVAAMPAECAFANLLARADTGDVKEFCFLDLGHTSTRMCIFTGRSFETNRVSDVGLAAADEAIAEGKSVDEHVARTYKHSNFEGVQEAEGLKEIYNAIAMEVRRTFNFYSFNNRESNLKDAWICGGGAHIAALKETIGQNAEDITFHDIAEMLPPISDTDTAPESFAAAIGAAVQPKDSLNLCIREKSQLPLKKVIPGVIIILLAAAALCKFGVADRLNKVNEAQAEVNALERQKAEIEAHIADYDAVSAQYERYSVGWMTDTEQAMVRRTEVLDLLESVLMSRSEILSAEIKGNTLSVQVSGMTLQQASQIVETLYSRDDVLSVAVYSAELTITPPETSDEEGAEAEETPAAPTARTVITMDITMQKADEGGDGK